MRLAYTRAAGIVRITLDQPSYLGDAYLFDACNLTVTERAALRAWIDGADARDQERALGDEPDEQDDPGPTAVQFLRTRQGEELFWDVVLEPQWLRDALASGELRRTPYQGQDGTPLVGLSLRSAPESILRAGAWVWTEGEHGINMGYVPPDYTNAPR